MNARRIFIAMGFVLSSVAPGLSTEISYQYDNLHRLTRVTYDDGSQIRYEYDAAGNRTMRIINNDCSPEFAELQLFIGQLLSSTPDPLYLCQFDLNNDGAMNALDIEPFVRIILGG